MMKTLIFIVLILMAWKGHALCAEFEPQRQTEETPRWLEEWYEEFEEKELLKEKELRRHLHRRDPRLDEGREDTA